MVLLNYSGSQQYSGSMSGSAGASLTMMWIAGSLSHFLDRCVGAFDKTLHYTVNVTVMVMVFGEGVMGVAKRATNDLSLIVLVLKRNNIN